MKKFILYFLLLLLIAGLVILTYGFWNAKNIRQWARQASGIKAEHNILPKEKDIESRFEASNGKEGEDLKNEMVVFQVELENIISEAHSAVEALEKLGAPRVASPVQKELADFYRQNKLQIQNLKKIVGFMNQLLEMAIIFDKIKPESTLGEIQNVISEAQAKSAGINPESLPEELRETGVELKSATNNFLLALNNTAAGKTEGHDELNSSYAAFSQKENEFFAAAKKSINAFPDMDALSQKIDNDLLILGNIKFSVK